MSAKSFKVRPSPPPGSSGGKSSGQAQTKSRGPFEAIISDTYLREFGGQTHTLGWLVPDGTSKNTGTGTGAIHRRPVQVLFCRETDKNLAPTGRVVVLSDMVRRLAQVALGDEVCLEKLDNDSLSTAMSVHLVRRELDPEEVDAGNKDKLLAAAKGNLETAAYICCGYEFELDHGNGKSGWRVQQVNGSACGGLYRTGPSINLVLSSRIGDANNMKMSRQGIFGLDIVLDQLDHALRYFRNVDPLSGCTTDDGPDSIFLVGPSGSGKTLVLNAFTRLGWSKVFRISSTDPKALAGIRSALTQAMDLGWALIAVDDIDEAGLEGRGSDRFMRELQKLLHEVQGRANRHVFLLATATDDSAAKRHLRAGYAFPISYRLGLPNIKAREDILRANLRHEFAPDLAVKYIASRTPAYNGNDLCTVAIRVREIQAQHPTEERQIAERWMDAAEEVLSTVRPMAMQGVDVEIPKTRLSDVGGQEALKVFLQKHIRRAMSERAMSKKNAMKPAKGVLMYGPPGCSKTLIARAIASEFGLNFFLVNAAELLDSYVGQSERNIRELFQRAQDMAQSLIFFDEFDTIGCSREDSHKGLNVVQTLLTEMDGLRPLRGVFVLAATNKPELLDAALLRPGRLHPHFLVGLPDAKARLEIIKIGLQNVKAEDIGNDVDWDGLQRVCVGCTGAEVEDFVGISLDHWCDEEALSATRQLTQKDFNAAIPRIKRKVTEDDIRRYQEWGQT